MVSVLYRRSSEGPSSVRGIGGQTRLLEIEIAAQCVRWSPQEFDRIPKRRIPKVSRHRRFFLSIPHLRHRSVSGKYAIVTMGASGSVRPPKAQQVEE
jgi:hypothetical protein